jgi:hypothetical protein
MYEATRRKMIRRADRLARKHDRAWFVIADRGALTLHDSALAVDQHAIMHTIITAIVYPDGTYHAGGRRHPITNAYY